MLVTLRKALWNAVPGGAVLRNCPWDGFSMPSAIMVISTAVMMLTKLTQLSQETLRRVRGRSQIQKMIRPTTAQTMVHVAPEVRVLRQIVHVRMCDAMLKMRKIVCAAPPISRPIAAAVGPRGLNRT